MKTRTVILLLASVLLTSCAEKKYSVQFLATVDEGKKKVPSIGTSIYILDSTKVNPHLPVLIKKYQYAYYHCLSNIDTFKDCISKDFQNNNECDIYFLSALHSLDSMNLYTFQEYIDFSNEYKKEKTEFMNNESTFKLITDANGAASMELPAGKYYALAISPDANTIYNPAEMYSTRILVLNIQKYKPNYFSMSNLNYGLNIQNTYTYIGVFKSKF